MSEGYIDFSNLIDEFDRLEEKPRDEYVRAPFGWPGGKYFSLSEIHPRLPMRKIWVDVCGGSGVVTINRKKSELEVFNDRYSGVTTFFRCIREREKMEALVQRLRFMIHSREEFIWSAATWENPTDDVERAARWYYMVRTSFSQLGRNWARATNSSAVIGPKFQRGLKLFPMLFERFKDVQVENQDCVQCILDYDSFDTVFYVDPDYLGTDPGIYQHRVNHKALLDTIHSSKGFFAVSGYANELYDSYPWDNRHTWSVRVTSQSKAKTKTNHLQGKDMMDGNLKAEEVLWIRESK